MGRNQLRVTSGKCGEKLRYVLTMANKTRSGFPVPCS